MQDYRNIYQIARESSGLTQEKASELIDISVDALRSYEYDRRVPSDKVVIKMIEIYDAQFLAYQHLKTKSKLGDRLLPNLKIKNFSEAVLTLDTEISDYDGFCKKLFKIASDNKVNDDEVEEFEKIMKELDEVVEAIMTLKFSKK
ncbi:helix-turn-helix domain-containing protein [Clostridium butyricum]|uniref:helix-turn-helix domain-containing protein n=1 Tax=Clostridium butyricum TaxID=1492 RepID=UPI0024B9F13D